MDDMEYGEWCSRLITLVNEALESDQISANQITGAFQMISWKIYNDNAELTKVLANYTGNAKSN